jgi:hypothetical protein
MSWQNEKCREYQNWLWMSKRHSCFYQGQDNELIQDVSEPLKFFQLENWDLKF